MSLLALILAASATAYAACPGHDSLKKADDVRWSRGETALARHIELRRTLGAVPPGPAPRVLLWAEGGDLETTTFSIVATRRADGIWTTDGVGQSRSWAPGASPEVTEKFHRELTSEQGRSLDRAIAEPCLLNGPTNLNDGNIVAGGLYETLEIDLRHRHWIGSWHGLITPQQNAVFDLIGKH